MMAIHIQNKLFSDLVLVVDDGNKKCAGVALWAPPRTEPLGWIEWGAKLLHSAYGELMGYLYYRNRGVNREVCPLERGSDCCRDIGRFGRCRRRLRKRFLERSTRGILFTCIFSRRTRNIKDRGSEVHWYVMLRNR